MATSIASIPVSRSVISLMMQLGDSEAGPRLEASLVDLTILSSRVSPDDLAAAAGLPSDHSWRVGEKVATRSAAVQKYNGVSYQSRLPPYLSLREHLDDLISRLSPFSDTIAKLSEQIVAEERDQNRVRVWLLHQTHTDNFGLDLSPHQLRFIAELRAGLALDLYCLGTPLTQV